MALTTVSSDRLSTNVKNTNFTAAEKQDLTDDILPLAGQLGNRNLIINGAAQVNQRGSQTGITSSTYSVDRFRVAISAGGTWSFTQSTDSPDGFGNSVKLDCTASAASPGLVLIQQRIEGQNLQAFEKGTSTAKQFAVSFYVKTNKSGVYTVELKDDDNNRTVSKTITVSDANWNRYTLIFPADTTGAFGNDTGGSLYLSIWLAVTANSTYTNGTFSDGTWAALVNGNRVSNSNVNLADSTSNEFLLTGVQLEVGSVVTDFEHRSFAEELALCQRYYAKGRNRLTFNGVSGRYNFTTIGRHNMRAAPTVTGSFASQGMGAVEGYGSDSTNDLRQIYVQTTVGNGLDGTITYEANAEL